MIGDNQICLHLVAVGLFLVKRNRIRVAFSNSNFNGDLIDLSHARYILRLALLHCLPKLWQFRVLICVSVSIARVVVSVVAATLRICGVMVGRLGLKEFTI
ncbi:hypothetical protein VNO80_10363 [Phaseolus coccineus]|uniref:Uncharacterized protein n=1 Tax=Phaseolus coccineus TaxID=3886 RepID=A0AAN9ND88_PHACN